MIDREAPPCDVRAVVQNRQVWRDAARRRIVAVLGDHFKWSAIVDELAAFFFTPDRPPLRLSDMQRIAEELSDRIAVVAARRRCGVARRLYEDLERFAGERRFDLLTCEYNLRPPNDDSARFHGRLGFAEVGRQNTEQGQKTVSLQIKTLRGSSGPVPSSTFPGGDSQPDAPSAK